MAAYRSATGRLSARPGRLEPARGSVRPRVHRPRPVRRASPGLRRSLAGPAEREAAQRGAGAAWARPDNGPARLR